MTANSNSDTDSDTDSDEPDLPTRNDVLGMLSGSLDEATRKAESGRVRDVDNEKVRQGWMRTVARLASEYRKVLNDRDDLDELRERVEALEDDDGTSDYRYK